MGSHTSLYDRITEHFLNRPHEIFTTTQLAVQFGTTTHAIRQAVFMIRKKGTPIRTKRGFILERGEIHGLPENPTKRNLRTPGE